MQTGDRAFLQIGPTQPQPAIQVGAWVTGQAQERLANSGGQQLAVMNGVEGRWYLERKNSDENTDRTCASDSATTSLQR
jgi:hypothetical protein